MTIYPESLVDALPGQVRLGESLRSHCTYRVGGAATAFVSVTSVADLEVIRQNTPAEVPFLTVGAGSNLLVSDSGFPGIVLQLNEDFGSVEIHEPSSPTDRVRVIVGGACLLPRVARQLVAANLTGFEWAVGVPGTIGGAVRMNAGGHGSDMAASVRSVSVYNMTTGGPRQWSGSECGFGYRSSAITAHDVVLFAELELQLGDGDEGKRELGQIVAWRRANQPGGQNAGSVFANPPDDSAGRLIDEAGLKGHRIGTAVVSDKHANFIQADPNGSAEDVAALIRYIQEKIHARYGIELHVENRLVGFSPTPEGAT